MYINEGRDIMDKYEAHEKSTVEMQKCKIHHFPMKISKYWIHFNFNSHRAGHIGPTPLNANCREKFVRC